MTKRILIADDHSAIRRGIKHILSEAFSKVEFGEATSSPEVFKLLKSAVWDIIILDLNLPGRNGFDILKHLKTEGCKLPILIFSFHHEDQVAVRTLKGGASGYLSKDSADKELVNAVNQILAGKKYITSSVAQQLAGQFSNQQNAESHNQLSDREFQIMLFIASGKTVTQISAELSLSASTVSTYRSRILEKMNMKSNAELMNYAIRQNMV